MKKEFSFLFGGDFFISEKFIKNELVSNEIIDFFKKADFRVLNFEAPIIKNETEVEPIIKTGPNLFMKQKSAIPTLKKLNVNLLTLANNHIMDYGEIGLKNTIIELNYNSIGYLGAGMSLSEAEKCYRIQADDFAISILNFAENEWSNAGINKPGANPLDIISNVKQIKKAKDNSEYLIVIIHGGHEYYHYPSPRMVQQYRFYAENGADAVIGHHSHCIGGFEIYKDVPIIYSLGNFLFTIPSNMDIWYEGLLAKLYISKKNGIKFELFPVKQDKSNFEISLPKEEEKEVIFHKLAKFNKIITDDLLLQKKWEEYVNDRSKSYLQLLSPINNIENRYIRFALRKTGFKKHLMSKEYLKLILNLIRCEAHSDLTKEVLNKYLNETLN